MNNFLYENSWCFSLVDKCMNGIENLLFIRIHTVN